MKKIVSFVSKDLPISLDFLKQKFLLDNNDNELNKILKIACDNVELKHSVNIIQKELKIVHNNNFINLGGPVIDIISIYNAEGVEIVPVSVSRANDNVMLKFDENLGYICVTYKVGYNQNNIPNCLKNTIVEEFYKVYSENSQKFDHFTGQFNLNNYENQNMVNKVYVYKN
mgnify:CR=1 FL=1